MSKGEQLLTKLYVSDSFVWKLRSNIFGMRKLRKPGRCGARPNLCVSDNLELENKDFGCPRKATEK